MRTVEKVAAQIPFHSILGVRCQELLLADRTGPQVFPTDNIQYAIWKIQIPSDALWH